MQENKPSISRTLVKGMFKADKALWIIVAMLAVISLLVIYSSTASMAYRKAGGDTSHYLFKQFVSMLIGLGTIAVVQLFKVEFYKRISVAVFWGCIILQILTYVTGVELNGARRWYEIPGLGLTIQTSDFLRIGLVMMLASVLGARGEKIKDTRLIPWLKQSISKRLKLTNYDIFTANTLPLLWGIVVACALILFTNFSTSAITFITSFLILVVAGFKSSELTKLFLLVFAAAVLAVSAMGVLGLGRSSTVTSRIKTFVGANESNHEDQVKDFQAEQARIAVASGGIIGKGPGNSTQRANLPHSYSDYAFAFIVEEYGVAGALIVVILYIWLFSRAMVIARACTDSYSRLLVLGLALMIVVQAFFNILVSVDIFPVTGQPLPLISLGGSSMISSSLALGMIFAVSRQINIIKERDEKNNS
ncbi:MAG: FtsW/RodA/SpoVE family cell cycle protein [Rikenellaceae bacterium]